LAVGLLALVGTYLAKVRVYTTGASAWATQSHLTLIETTLLHKWRITEVAVDFVLVSSSYVIAHMLRFEANLTLDLEVLVLKSLPLIIGVKMFCFFACGIYRGVWRYIGLNDLVNILRAVVLGSILSAVLLLYLWRFEGYSRAVFVIDGLLLFLGVCGARLTEPLLNEWISASAQDAIPVLMVGAGDTGVFALQQLKLDTQRKRRVVGFLDDDASKQGNRIHGIPILGSRYRLGEIAQEYGIREVLIAMSRPPTELVQQIKSYCEENGLQWQMVNALASDAAPTSSVP
jgi:UDP-GlcNAc:undecaprenyl-phosphate GlcNAc-1-phosphate transferase